MAVQFYLGPNTEPYLARVDSTTRLPEIFWPRSSRWVPFSELDTLHDVTAITRAQALSAIPGMTEQLLDAPAAAQ